MKSLLTTTPTSLSLIPSLPVARNLFAVGATLGPIVDGLHNQCLLRYNVAPIVLDWPTASSTTIAATTAAITSSSAEASYFEPHLFASSWVVPPLLGIAYVVLGGILPRVLQAMILVLTPMSPSSLSSFSSPSSSASSLPKQSHSLAGQGQPTQGATTPMAAESSSASPSSSQNTRPRTSMMLGVQALLAVLSTAAIIRLSEYLILHPEGRGLAFLDNPSAFEGAEAAEQHLLILITAAVCQWAYLDGTLVSLLAGSLAAMVGPLSELPFVAAGVWTYWPEAGDIYQPIRDFVEWWSPYYPTTTITTTSTSVTSSMNALIPTTWLGSDTVQQLALNSVTGPCYFAVTMDAIAIGRWLDAVEHDDDGAILPSLSPQSEVDGIVASSTLSDGCVMASSSSSFHEDETQERG